MTIRTAIEIKNLTKRYRGNPQPAVNGVSLDIEEGHFFGLLGPNGAGKTTMIKIMCGLLSPSSGEVTIGGLSLRKQLPEIKRSIGIVPQDIALYSTLTARENLKIFGGLYGIPARKLKERIDKWFSIFGLEKNREQTIGSYSGGMKRRLNLIAGILHEPKILFLDEPTVGIDVQSKKVITENLREINQGGTTIVYTSHYLEEAESLCSSIAIIDQGVIIIKGTMEEIRSETNNMSKLEDIFLQLTGMEPRD
ncbi:MAG TPA: ABC transporter ATP-binding protein [Bacteroidales bacterium]|jgi:ABC-2 type transport system ATP-binding protein|nr:ABC transporter ATP-binding protein [Bacteroidales bacterium]HQG77103.1 ABC transporter ATP-binding protein [Bacteroidales bacterium]